MSPTPYVQSIPIPYGIAHPGGSVGCLQTSVEGRVACFDLMCGAKLAQSETVLHPLLIEDNFLVAWSAATQGSNKFELQNLTIHDYQLQLSWSTEIALPDWVRLGAAPAHRVSLKAGPEGEFLILTWDAHWNPAPGSIQSSKVDDNRTFAKTGTIHIRLTDGAIVDEAERSLDNSDPKSAQHAYQLPRVLYKRGAQMDGALWTVEELDMLLVREDESHNESLYLRQWRHNDGNPADILSLGEYPDVTPLVSPNGEHIYVPRDDQQADLFSATTGELLGTVPNEEGVVDIACVASLMIYRLLQQNFTSKNGYTHKRHELRVRDVRAGDLLWERLMYEEVETMPPMQFQ